jgi:hypothetical protein
VILVANGGAPEVEYLLFDPGDIELHASEPGTIREVGFSTTEAAARARLAELGVTSAGASEAAQAAKPSLAHAYARGAAVRCIADALDAVELFEGGTFVAEGGGYQGAWLELPALVKDLARPDAPGLLQAFHLAALLSERDSGEPLVLATSDLTSHRKPGARTYRRPALGDPRELARALAAFQPSQRRSEDGPAPQDILARLQARAHRTPASRERMHAIEAALAARAAPGSGPLADPELWAIERTLSEGHARQAVDQLDALERRRGRLPATAYLRARAALLAGSEDPRALAERVSALSTSMPTFHELELLAAQAWAAAGDPRRAAAFARDLADNAGACDSVRMQAQDLVRAGAGRMSAPPSRSGSAPRARARSIPPAPATPRVGSRGDLRPAAVHFSVEPMGGRWSLPPAGATGAEPLSTLGLPAGALDAQGESAASPPDPPRTPLEARVYCTLLARELGRTLHDLQGGDVHCDLDGLEVAQRHLREALPEGGVRTLKPDEQRLVALHGALLGELLARKLGARWADLEGDDMHRWAMLVPAPSRSEMARVWPFARVARFVAMGHKERDLVSYVLELELRAR